MPKTPILHTWRTYNVASDIRALAEERAGEVRRSNVQVEVAAMATSRADFIRTLRANKITHLTTTQLARQMTTYGGGAASAHWEGHDGAVAALRHGGVAVRIHDHGADDATRWVVID